MRQWQVRRALQPHPDGQRRWDRTDQQLMAWTQTPHSGAVVPAGPVPPPEEDSYEDRDLLGFKWSSQHLERGGCDGHSEAAFGSVRARRLAVARSALCRA